MLIGDDDEKKVIVNPNLSICFYCKPTQTNAWHSMNNPYPTHTLHYDGRTGSLYRIWLLNMLLNIPTLGIYSFWGKTRMRRYIASCYQLLGDRFEYTGTGKEMFLGFLKALPIIIAIYIPILVWPVENHPWVAVFFVIAIALFFVATYAAMRYRMSRTTWRGIRGELGGSAWEYGLKLFGLMIVAFGTLLILMPYVTVWGHRYMVRHAKFGNVQANFDGDWKPLMPTWIICLLLLIPTLTLSRFWYQAKMLRYLFGHTTIGGIRLKHTATPGNLMRLKIINGLLLAFTFGLATPYIIQRNMRYFADNVQLVGHLESQLIGQAQQRPGAIGEGVDAGGVDAAFL
jgi:uncharacterized membrane protein YjgN (DUF898 family)